MIILNESYEIAKETIESFPYHELVRFEISPSFDFDEENGGFERHIIRTDETIREDWRTWAFFYKTSNDLVFWTGRSDVDCEPVRIHWFDKN